MSKATERVLAGFLLLGIFGIWTIAVYIAFPRHWSGYRGARVGAAVLAYTAYVAAALEAVAEAPRTLDGLMRSLALPMPGETGGYCRSPSALAAAQARWRVQRG